MTFRQFAFNNVLRNMRTYAAYFLSSVFSVLVFFVYAVFAFHPELSGDSLNSGVTQGMLLAEGIIYVFSFFFVLYSMSAFLKSRKREFGLLMMQGMTSFQLRLMVFLENILIGFFATLSGVGLGLVSAKLILMIAENVLDLDDSLPFYFPVEAVLLTFGAFMLLFMSISIFTVMIIRSKGLIELIRGSDKPKPEPKASALLSLLAVLLLGGGYVAALWVRGLMVAAAMIPVTVVVIIGTYFLFTQLSVYLVRYLRNRRHLFWRRTNMLLFSDLAYRMKDNARMFFIVAILSTVAFSAIGALVGFRSMTNNVFRQENPYAFEYTSFRGNPEDVEEQHIRLIEKTLYEEEIDYRRVSGVIRLQEQADTNDAVEVISVSEFNAFATAAGQETVALGEHEALQLYYANGLISGHNEEPYQLRLAGSASVVEVDVIDARESYLFPVYTQMYVLPDHLIDSLKEPVRKMRYHAFEVDNLPATRQAGKRLSEALPGAEGYTFFATEYDLHKVNQSFGAILFVGFFIGAVFFVAAGSFLYFRLYTDLADDKRKFAAIMKLGLTDGELSSVITKQLAILFLVPIGVATVHGAVALTALQHMFNYSLVKESVIVLGGFVLVQLIYFLLIRFRYIRLVKGA